jgi:hypothetical protein
MLRRLRKQGAKQPNASDRSELLTLTLMRRYEAKYAAHMTLEWVPWFIQLLDDLAPPSTIPVLLILPGHYRKLALLRKHRAWKYRQHLESKDRRTH